MSSGVFVVNNKVKMEWEKSGFVVTKGSAGNSFFTFASQEYPSTNKGLVTVFFNPSTAWIWASDPHTGDEDLWNASELKSWLKEPGNFTDLFPNGWAEYVSVIANGDDTASQQILDEYGISQHKADIEARLRDLEGYLDDEPVGLK